MKLYTKKMYPSSEELIGIATKVDGRRNYFSQFNSLSEGHNQLNISFHVPKIFVYIQIKHTAFTGMEKNKKIE